MANVYNYNFFQVDQTGVNSATLGPGIATRPLDMKLSSFGDLNRGLRMSSDYTRTVLSFKGKDDTSDWSNVVPAWQWADRNRNPFVAGSSVKKIWDDQFTRLSMENNKNESNKGVLPKADVMNTKASSGSFSDPQKYPAEGWHSFGGKYDFEKTYQG